MTKDKAVMVSEVKCRAKRRPVRLCKMCHTNIYHTFPPAPPIPSALPQNLKY